MARPTALLAWITGILAALALSGCADAPEPDLRPRTTKKARSETAPLLGGDSDSTDAPCGADGIGPKTTCGVEFAPDTAPAGSPIKASLSVTRRQDGASFTNCLKIQVNKGPEIDLGCNKGALAENVQIDALARPACNEVRLILYSNGTKNRTTESAANVARDFRIARLATSSFAIQCNDNGDDDFNDLNLDISSDDAALSIENTGFGCGG